MNPESLNQAANIISTHGYWFIFFAMIVEGPIVTISAAFASALGIFHFYPILMLSILADTIADVLYYSIGYWGRLKIVEKYSKRFGFKAQRVQRIEKLLRQNLFVAITVVKITPGLATLGLIITGSLKIPFKQFIKNCLYITLPKCLTFVILGYYAGLANIIAERYLHYSQYELIIAAIAVVSGSYLYQRVSTAIVRRIKEV